jgi:hypothetical protein
MPPISTVPPPPAPATGLRFQLVVPLPQISTGGTPCSDFNHISSCRSASQCVDLPLRHRLMSMTIFSDSTPTGNVDLELPAGLFLAFLNLQLCKFIVAIFTGTHLQLHSQKPSRYVRKIATISTRSCNWSANFIYTEHE